MIGDKNVNNEKKMSEYRVAVNMNVKIDLYVNAGSYQDAIAKAEEMMYELDNDTALRPNIPDGAIGLDIDEVYCTVSSAIEME